VSRKKKERFPPFPPPPFLSYDSRTNRQNTGGKSKKEKKGRKKHTFGSSNEASTPGFKFLKSLKTPSSNFFILRTGLPKA
jgi:hypothetical protein